MHDVVVGVQGTISDGTHDIEVIVHSHNVGNPSPCHVYENRIYRGMIGGSINSLDQIFDHQAGLHAGFAVKSREYYIARINSDDDPGGAESEKNNC
jgi:hypothetical protein